MAARHAYKPIQVFFEFNSFYSYPAVFAVKEAAAREGVEVRWRPFLLWPVMKARGHKAPPFQADPVKGAYMMRDAERAAARSGLAFSMPPDFPHNTVLATRVACLFQDEPWAFDYISRIYTAEFVAGQNVGDESVVAAALAAAGQDPTAALAAASAPAAKDKLRAQTDEALRLGLFGAPTLVVGGSAGEAPELFWGQDRVADAVDWACGRHALQRRQQQGGAGTEAPPTLPPPRL